MKYDAGIRTKLALILFGLLFLLCVWLGRRERRQEMPEGEKITCGDVRVLMDAIEAPVPESVRQAGEDTYLTCGQYAELCGLIGDGDGQLADYGRRFDQDSPMPKDDWYKAYRIMLAYLDSESSVWETEIFLLGADEESGEFHTENGTFAAADGCRTAEIASLALRSLRVCVRGDELLTLVGEAAGTHTLHNVWVTEETEGELQCFYRGAAFTAAADETVPRESVADLTFRDGRAVEAREKTEKVHGRLLRCGDGEMEIEDCGVYPVAEGMEVYKLYGAFGTLGQEDLRIGYADTDYVIDGGKICACLVSGREDADMIRVLLKNTETGGNYHESAEFVTDGERVKIEAADLQVGERKSFRCAALTDRVAVYADGLQGEESTYRGVIECYRDESGMTLINELPLEEYLYAVVPSEMPSSYPAEALKAQAVCARTYACRYIRHAGLPEFGAHVDDTTAYQVYHNIGESAAATAAVRETDGMVLAREGQAAEIFYYSTSCGTGDYTPEELCDEDTFRGFITSAWDSDPEREEPWYRWTYTADAVDRDEMTARVRQRYAADPVSVLTEAEGGYYVSEPVETLGKLRDIRVTKRGPGGVAEELVIETTTGTYKIVGEYNIRYVLCDGESEVIRQDGSGVTPEALVPSGFFVIDTGQRGESMVGYTLTGGGYGHGRGMSQNGAKALGGQGMSWKEILRVFFADCTAVNGASLEDT